MRYCFESQNDSNLSSVFMSSGLAQALNLQALPADWQALSAHASLSYIFLKA